MLYSKCLTSEGYIDLPEALEIEQFAKKGNYRYEHVHRAWEYGLAMTLIKQYEPKTMLNVGGGNSPLSMWAAERGVEVTEIDPNKPSQLFANITYIHEPFPAKGLRQYEFVVCTSVIEHIDKDDMHFFKYLLDHAKDIMFLTTDFHPTGKAFSQAHYRTYNQTDMILMMEIARIRGFDLIGREFDYTYKDNMVYDYTFASLALVRNV